MKMMRAGVVWFTFVAACHCFAATRHYYIAAEDVLWNYAPSGKNLMNGNAIPQPWASRVEWPKSRFIEYTDSTFATKKPQPTWLGILGPIIRAEVGDEIVVEFLNRGRQGHDMHPHGLRYDKENEGSLYLPIVKGAFVAPGARYTYHWFAIPSSGPGVNQPSSIVWWYHAHVDPAVEINAGLMGPIIVTAKGKANPDATPKDVDREFVSSFEVFDELAGKPPGLLYSINGFIFGNLPGLMMKKGQKVRWHVLAMGNEIDLHTPHWHGETVTLSGQNADVVELLPGSMKTVDMIADNPGTWMFHCHVDEHMENGMMAVYTIYVPPTRECPVGIEQGDFWSHPEQFSVTAKNTGRKKISSMTLISEMLLTPQDLQRPFNAEWSSKEPISPGAETALSKPGMRANSAQSVMGWVVFPSSVRYEDGTTWAPQSEGECFSVVWRDKEHPEMPALPPRQRELNAD